MIVAKVISTPVQGAGVDKKNRSEYEIVTVVGNGKGELVTDKEYKCSLSVARIVEQKGHGKIK